MSVRTRILASVSVGLVVLTGILVPLELGGNPPSLKSHFGLTAPSGPPTGTQVCNNGSDSSLLTNPLSSPPGGAITVPAGDDSILTMSDGNLITTNYGMTANKTYWLAAGAHTLGTSPYGQIDPQTNDVIEGAPGAILDGQSVNTSAFDNNTDASGGISTGVIIEYLTIENFVPGNDAIVVNHDSNPTWTMQYNTIENNTGAAVGAGNSNTIHENCLYGNTQYGFDIAAGNTAGVGGISLTNNEISYNDSGGAYDQNAYTVSYAVSGGTATIVTKGAMNLVVGDTINIGTGGAGNTCNFAWCANLGLTTLDGLQTITGVSTGSKCNSGGHYLCTHFTFATGASNVGTTADTTGTVASPEIQEGGAGGGKFFNIQGSSGINGATISNNWVHDNGYSGLWPDTNNAGFQITGNYISNNWAQGILYEASYNAQIENNSFVDNAWGMGPSPATGGVLAPAIYVSESGSTTLNNGSDSYKTTLDIVNNGFYDNWDAISEYEDGNRACGIENDALCPLTGSPTTFTVNNCATNLPNSTTSGTDYPDNCRWKTENVNISDNEFDWTPADIPNCTGTTSDLCGYNGMFASTGYATHPSNVLNCVTPTNGNVVCNGSGTTSPAWPDSDTFPYVSYTIPNNLSNSQNDTWTSNTYCAGSGTWGFMGFNQGNTMTKSQWLAGESGLGGFPGTFPAQDSGSTFSSGSCASGPNASEVTNCNDSGTGSLRQIAGAGAPGTTIVFGLACSSITLTGGPIALGGLTLTGPGANALAVSGGGSSRVFATTGNTTISGLTIQSGSVNGNGAGILNSGNLTLTGDVLSGNTSTDNGGAIYNTGTLAVNASTLSGNSSGATHYGGAIANIFGTTTLSNDTLAGDSAPVGSDLYNYFGVMTIANSTLSGNTGAAAYSPGGAISIVASILAHTTANGNSSTNCVGHITDSGYNLDDGSSCGFSGTSLTSTASGLSGSGLQNNGGTTPTIALTGGSAALAFVTAADCPATDQRGTARSIPCAIGAYE